MGRAPCCSGEHEGLKKGPWSHEEDMMLKSFLLDHPNTSWRLVPQKAGLLRCGKSCRLRWMNYLRPDIRRGNFSPEEEELIVRLHEAVGNKWSIIASQLPGRTDNEIKNLWNTKLRKMLVLKGINPITHQPFCTPQVSDYVRNWVKSIESALLMGLATQIVPPTPNLGDAAASSISLGNPLGAPLPPLLPAFVQTQPIPALDVPRLFSPGVADSGMVDDSCSYSNEKPVLQDAILGGDELMSVDMGFFKDELVSGMEINNPFLLGDVNLPGGGDGMPLCFDRDLKFWG